MNSSDYKDSLHLPKTQFAMKANLKSKELEILKFWAEIDLTKLLRQQANQLNLPKYTICDGPPYANGDLHMGHAVNKILKDIINKSKTFSGFQTEMVPGWDCHGLPIAIQVEKLLGKAYKNMPAEEFRAKCREYAAEQVLIQKKSFQRLGVFALWDQPYLTMDKKYEANCIATLGLIIKQGHVQAGFRPVLWCFDCQSALAEAEMEYQDKQSEALYVSFHLAKDQLNKLNKMNWQHPQPKDFRPAFVIWTTTAWSLAANEALALNAQHDYSLVQFTKDHKCLEFILATELLPKVLAEWSVDDYKILAHAPGSLFLGLNCEHPLDPRLVPIILAEHVNLEAGTGCVHTAPAHGMDDYLACKPLNLPLQSLIDDRGCYRNSVKHFAGQFVFKATSSIIEELKTLGKFVHSSKITHKYPHCWRHKSPLIYRATPQWFISMDNQNLRSQAIEALDEVSMYPAWAKERLSTMVSKRPDWCISRQKPWGVPICLWVDKETGELHPETLNLIEQIVVLVEEQGIESWHQLDAASLAVDSARYDKVQDTLDVWFDSGVAHLALHDYQEFTSPCDLVLEGSDQHRGWFQSSLLCSVAATGQAPYKSILSHGFVVDAKGRKMSKSLKNIISPDKITNSMGADIIRLWVAAADYSTEMNVSDEILNRISDTYRRIRNTLRFALGNLFDFDPSTDSLELDDLLALDKWLLARLEIVQAEIIACYDKFEFHNIYQKLHNFCVTDLGGFYLDIVKDRLYTAKSDGRARRSAQTALQHLLEVLSRCLAPILSFTIEELWPCIPGARTKSVFLSKWYSLPQLSKQDHVKLNVWPKIMQIKMSINKLIEKERVLGHLGSGLEAKIVLYADPNYFQLLYPLIEELKFILIVSKVQLLKLGTENASCETLIEGQLMMQITALQLDKCLRCWNLEESVNQNHLYPGICERCVSNVYETGEQRHYA